MKFFNYLILILAFFLSVGCDKRLDDFLFNNDDTITAYKLDNFEGPVSVELSSQYFVPDNMINQFTYDIESEGENLNISAIYTGDINTISTDTVILYCHGNRDHMDFYWPRQKLYSHLGNLGRYGVLMFDYPGFGLSEGKPTEQNMYDAVDGALKWLKVNGLTNNRLVMFGFSLGSASVCKVAGEQNFSMNPSKIILEAPFASSEVMVQDAALLNMPASYFVNVEIANAEQIKNVDVPFLWMHGVNDDFLSITTHGQVVYDNYNLNGPFKKAIKVPGAGHETVPVFLGLENYQNEILDFIVSN
jgi:pimeloyl-ACP methyl ester carboxylesterase